MQGGTEGGRGRRDAETSWMSDEESDSSVFVSVLLEQLKYNYTTVENNFKKLLVVVFLLTYFILNWS